MTDTWRRTAHPEGQAIGSALAAGIAGLPRCRSDWWNRLRDAGRRLAKAEHAAEQASLRDVCSELLNRIERLETYHAFPGPPALPWLRSLMQDDAPAFAEAVARIGRVRASETHRRIDLATARVTDFVDLLRRDNRSFHTGRMLPKERPYFEVLLVEDAPPEDVREFKVQLRALRASDEPFVYEVIPVSSFEDALLAVLANPDIAVVVARFGFPFSSEAALPWLGAIYQMLRVDRDAVADLPPGERTTHLGRLLQELRPELDLYRVTNAPVESVVGEGSRPFRRVFYQAEDYQDLHVSILRGVAERFEAPFFDALRRYAERPTGMFHALPVSRGRTIAKSHWISDYGDFYGPRLFMAETSATTGGLDSLLQPTGSLRDAQDSASRAFGSDRTYFVTNGTSTANKIVVQALVQPGDIVLYGHDCHKSHPYAVILAGGYPVVLDGYALDTLSMYGGVPLDSLLERLLCLRQLGQLHRVRLVLLTNITFDGITYDPYRVMRAVLAIHPDVAFLWDEAWFAYGRFAPLCRGRTAMAAARRLDRELASPDYAATYERWKANTDLTPDDVYRAGTALPDPSLARVRVYATQSTHKTLTALRQGSMIHILDRDFERQIERAFSEAYMTHTSTSPNYQILASLDVGRRQAELEGFRLVAESIDLAMLLRERIRNDRLLSRYFGVCGPSDMVPEGFRPSRIERYVQDDGTVAPLESAWECDEFVLDPTRVTVHVGRTGYDGDAFKRMLMDDYAIHINKTSRNSVLFLIHIGAARGTVAHLVKVLTEVADRIERRLEHAPAAERERFDARVRALTHELPPLPNFSAFHPAFVPADLVGSGAGDMRAAYFLAYDPDATAHQPLDATLVQAVVDGTAVVSASFVTPYPPGFPVLVPGQIVSSEILHYLLALDTKEIHGLHPELGLRVFRPEAIAALEAPRSLGTVRHRQSSKRPAAPAPALSQEEPS